MNQNKKRKTIFVKSSQICKTTATKLYFGLNAPSRRGTQTPFTNITLDWVCPPDLKDKALMLGGAEFGYYKKVWRVTRRNASIK